MVKLSSIMKTIIILSTLLMLRYPLLIPGGDTWGGRSTQQGIIVIMGGLSAIYLLSGRAGRGIIQETKWLKKYLIPYGIAIFVSMLYSCAVRGYTLYSVVSGIVPFSLVVLAIPIIYIFKCDGGYLKLIRTVAILEFIILICKTFGWYFYNFGGPSFFQALTLEFDGWVRNGLQRVEPGQLFALSLVFFLYQGFRNRPTFQDIAIVVFMMVFLVVICQFRFQIAVAVATIFIMLYFMYRKQSAKLWMRLLLIMVVMGILLSGIVSQVVESASLTGKYGASSQARINTTLHYFDIMSRQGAYLGLGLLDSHDSGADEIMRLSVDRLYYLDDIGILGGIVRFGFLTIIIYGYLFVMTFRTCYRCYKYKNITHLPFLIGISGYMIMSCLLLNIFDRQRAYAVPFYLAVISYIDAQIEREKDEKKSLV